MSLHELRGLVAEAERHQLREMPDDMLESLLITLGDYVAELRREQIRRRESAGGGKVFKGMDAKPSQQKKKR